ncbi:alpha/beta hydrolase family protein [Tenacibaculum halocynthiae]|uniref:alpha/beta hydrolase family protein n=1 Tax=Tenacibaculum halocynthiae TaxID=1254437 RepID=UPI0038938A83
MKVKLIVILFIILLQSCKNVDFEKNKKHYLEKQTEFAIPMWNYIKGNSYQLNILNQNIFTQKIDSLQLIFTSYLNKNKGKLDQKTFNEETVLIKLAFDKLILEYPELHKRYTGKNIVLSKKNQSKLNKNIKVFNDTTFFLTKDLKDYVASYIRIEANKKLENSVFGKSDNQQLQADLSVIDEVFTTTKISDFWKHKYIKHHINNLGIKNINKIYSSFMMTCKTAEYKENISKLYTSHKKERENHSIETYKEVDGFKLELHLFLPNKEKFKGNRPTIVQFHGGSWSEGKPDWFFSTAEEYAKQGWVVAVVEYRIKGKQNTYPFEAVKDAKSSIRWIRENSEVYNIDVNKIIATGNSAGGHLSLAISLANNWNEKSDNLKTSAMPNVIVVNSGVYDLTTNSNRWIVEKKLNKDVVKEISPNHLLKKSKVKMLLIHGDKDKNCHYETAQYFYKQMSVLGNDIQFYTVKDADHWIWFGKHSKEVSKVTREYLRKLNFN